jgi:hypothetical protein
MGEGHRLQNTDPHLRPFSNSELCTNHLSGSHSVPKGITTFLSVLSNFKIWKRIVLKESKILASANNDTGSSTSGVTPPQPKVINVTFSSHTTEKAAFVNNER